MDKNSDCIARNKETSLKIKLTLAHLQENQEY